MNEILKPINKFSMNLEDKKAFSFYESNDFLISKIINQVALESAKDIFYITKDTKKCKLIIEYLEEVWKKKIFYLGSDILNSQNNDLNNRNRSLNILYFLGNNNNKIKFIEKENLYHPFSEGINKNKVTISTKSVKEERQRLINSLEKFGYKKNEFTEKLGDYSVRGSIIDIFTPSFKAPIRIEFHNDKIRSINTFNIESERRLSESLEEINIVSLEKEISTEDELLILDHIKDGIVFTDCVIKNSSDEADRIKKFTNLNKIIEINPIKYRESSESYKFKVEYLNGNLNESIPKLIEFINEYGLKNQITIISKKDSIENLKIDLAEVKKTEILYLNGFLRKSFISRDTNEIFISFNAQNISKNQSLSSQKYAQSSFKLSGFNDLKIGDMVIHKEFGLCAFNGIKNKLIGSMHVDFIECEFSHKDLLLIPIDRISLVQKYIGSLRNKSLDTLRSKAWGGKVKKAKRAAETTAREILSLYAQRKSAKGFQFKINNNEILDFEDTFEFEETVDQKSAILDTYKDMQAQIPMDRLICGDVGFGKTEVALRASFLSSMNLKQTAVVAPTTLLAHQHLKTFKNRFQKFPIRIEGVTRFTKKSDLNKIIEDSVNGKIDILIGTHKIFSKEIVLKNLGLIIIDEEHKFGVSDKEKIKQLKKGVDSLSISATPIPRTLQLSLSGLREISLLATPPKERLSIETYIEEFDLLLIKESIDFELKRNGRVFFIHNEIASIEKIYLKIKKICPGIKIEFIHGRMTGDKVEETLKQFIDGDIKILITTTIVEAGLDIREANTMIINNAHKFGLSDLYQLRGRIGRGDKKGKAFLLIPNEEISDNAKKRLEAIRKLTKLGSGFNIAMEDLEIRGAGNLFGTQQSGNIFDVGIEFYLELLEKEISKVKNNNIDENQEAEVIYNQNVYIPENYIESAERRLFYYKKISLVATKKEYLDLIEELLDKFGLVPLEVQNLINISLIKINLQRMGVHKILIKDSSIVIYSKKFKKLKEIQIEIRNLKSEPKEITKFLEEKSNIEEILKSDYEIVNGKFIIDNK